jgi:UDP:flavonoid glycosyltransferase YjiC (YdhE family)
MRIAIIALGSQGDVQPYVALGKGLKAAGHFVRLLSHENFAGLVNSHGLEFCPMYGNVREIVESPEMRKLLEKGNILAINSYTTKETQRAAINWAQTGLMACQDIDLLLAGVGGLYLGLALAEKLSLPLLRLSLHPNQNISRCSLSPVPSQIWRCCELAIPSCGETNSLARFSQRGYISAQAGT